MAIGRIFNIIQYFEVNGEKLVNMELITAQLDGHAGIKQWAYAIHDEDVYVTEDAEKREKIINGKTENLEILKTKEEKTKNDEKEIKKIEKTLKYYEQFPVVIGNKKPKHIHIVLSYPNKIDTSSISRWLGIPEHLIDIPKGQGAFLDCVQYLTHEKAIEQAKGKHLYPDDVIKANFQWREALEERKKNKEKYGQDVDDKVLQRLQVLQEGRTLKQCLKDNPVLFTTELAKLKELRNYWLCSQEPPKRRINIYICGAAGTGKTTTSTILGSAIAELLNSNLTLISDQIYNIGAKGVEFDAYDGQPVMIWNDCRAIDLLYNLGSRSNMLNVFDSHPKKIMQNIKYGEMNIINSVNIIEGVQTSDTFLSSLAGSYIDRSGEKRESEDPQQVYRRFPVIIELGHEEFSIKISKKFFGKNVEKFNYYCTKKYPISIGNIITSDDEEDEEKTKKIKNILSPLTELIALFLTSDRLEVLSENVLLNSDKEDEQMGLVLPF